MAILSNVRAREDGMESEVTTGISLMFLPFCEQDTVSWRAKTECAVFKYRRKRRSGDLMKLGGEGPVSLSGKGRSGPRRRPGHPHARIFFHPSTYIPFHR